MPLLLNDKVICKFAAKVGTDALQINKDSRGI